VRQEAEKIYPDIIWKAIVYAKDGKQCVRVEIEHSGDTPHFGGPAWVSRGSETVKANDEEFQRLIDIRSSVVRELSKWVNKKITFATITTYGNGSKSSDTDEAQLRFVNSFFATFEYRNKRHRRPLHALVREPRQPVPNLSPIRKLLYILPAARKSEGLDTGC
jgi:hypothetical protein